MLLSQIAAALDYDISGDDREITGIAFLAKARESDIAVAFKKTDIAKTKARVILTAPVLMRTDKTLLFTHENIGLSIVRICDLLTENKLLPDHKSPVEYPLCAKGYYIGKNCRISEKAVVQPGVMIGNDVTIDDGCVIEPYVVIGSGTVMGSGVHADVGSKIGASSVYYYHDNSGSLRNFEGCGRVILGKNTYVGSNTIIQRGTISNTVIGSDCVIGCSVVIGHDVEIGNGCNIVTQTGISGGASLGDNVTVYGQSGIANDIVVGSNAVIKGRTAVSKSVKDGEVVYGEFGRNYYDEMRFWAKVRRYFNRKEE